MRKLLIVMALTAATAAMAEDYTDMVVVGKGETKIALDDFNAIRFAGGQMVVVNEEETMATFDLSDLSRLYFLPEGATPVELTTTTAGTASAEFFNLQGVRMGRFSSLPAGIYLMKNGSSVSKILKR